MSIPTPEELQYLLGIHPEQVMANQALLGGGQGDQPVSTEVAPASQPAPTAKGDAEPVEIKPRPSLLRHGPMVPALDVPPVGSPGPIDGSVVTGADSAGRPTLGPAGPTSLPVGAVPSVPKTASEPSAPPTDMLPIGGLVTAPTPARPISGDQAQEQKDRAELERLRTTGSGVSQFQKRHKFWGPIVRGLDIAGAVIAPGV